MRIANIDPTGEIATSLLREAAAEVRPLYAQPRAEPMPAPTNDPLRGRDLYVAAFLGDSPVGCGALREFDSTTAEVRRMYVRPQHRGKHVGHAILAHLIAGARELGYQRLILETGDKQASAIAFYENHGFKRIEPFAEHVNDKTSRCYELLIGRCRAGPQGKQCGSADN
ncbi:MAG: GNAT family N-acetyltransferase [Steroidobacteraceae bacterium]